MNKKSSSPILLANIPSSFSTQFTSSSNKFLVTCQIQYYMTDIHVYQIAPLQPDIQFY